MDQPIKLNVTYQGQLIGHVEVIERTIWKLIGRFIPREDFARNRQLFDEAIELAKRLDESIDSGTLDYLAFDQYVEVVNKLTQMIVLPELSAEIQDFAVYQGLEVEITLYPSSLS